MSKFLTDIVRGRFLGHPIHSMLVHFPSALFPSAWFFDLVSIISQNNLYSLIAFYILGLGVLSGILAAIFGAMDYVSLPPKDIAWKKASLHALLNVLWLCIFGTLFGISMIHYPDIKIVSLAQFIVLTITVFGLLISNFLGGELVFRHHVGLIKPKQK